MPAIIDEKKCNGCAACCIACDADAISLNDKAFVNADKCCDCGECIDICPKEAISMQK